MTPASPWLRGWLARGVTVSVGFVLLRFLLAPLRIRILTELLPPADYGMVTLISMSATGMAFVFSLGGFEVWLRQLPGAEPARRLQLFRGVWSYSTLFGGLAALGVLLGWGPAMWYGVDGVRLSAASVAALFLTFLHLHQRLYYLLGCNQHAKARATQLLWGDLWFLLLIPAGFVFGWSAGLALWVWSIWLLLMTLCTWSWVPVGSGLLAATITWHRRRDLLAGLAILPIVLAEWTFRLVGQYVVLSATDAVSMAFYALALNLALVGYAAGVPLVDVYMTTLNAHRATLPRAGSYEPPPELTAIITQALRWLVAINLPIALALIFLADPLVELLAAQVFRPVADLLPWAALLPGLMLLNLLLGRLALTLLRERQAAWAATLGALASVVLSVFWVRPHGAAGVFLAVTLGLLLTTVLFSIWLRAWRWVQAPAFGGARFLAGGSVLALSYAGLGQVQGYATLRLAAAVALAIGAWTSLRWVDWTAFNACIDRPVAD